MRDRRYNTRHSDIWHNDTQHKELNCDKSAQCYAKCRMFYCNAECNYAECRIFIVLLNVVVLSVVILNVMARRETLWNVL